MTARKHMPIREFVELGYLQEVNRLLLHPLGVALEVAVKKDCGRCDGTGQFDDRDLIDDRLCPRCGGSGNRPEEDWEYALSGVWDKRGDLEGIYLGEDAHPLEERVRKAQYVEAESRRRRDPREKALGYVIQPLTEKQA